MLGVSPRFFAEVQGAGIKPSMFHLYCAITCFNARIVEIAPFPALRAIFVTGAVFTAPMFRWFYNVFPKYIFLTNGSGGTDICAACE